MILFLTIIAVFIVYYFIEAREDYYLAHTESELKNCRIRLRETQLLGVDLLRKKAWHKVGFWKFIALVSGLGFAIYGLDPIVIAFVASVMSLKGIVFGIRLNLLFGADWNHVGESGLEGKFKGKETLYFILVFLTFIISSGILIFLLWPRN